MISRITALTNSALSFKGQRLNNNRTNISDDYYSCDEFISRSSNRHMEVPPRYANPPKGTIKTILRIS